jgi:NADH-quinone oxidoreductase subunit G
MSDVVVKIDGIECKAKEGDYILNIARANGIFIPALCYLTNCSPTLACRLCLVEIDGKRAYSCNSKAKDGMNVVTKTEEIEKERRAIMEVYDVNHPLECGVCDQSGECELQNYTLEMGVDSQSYCVKDTHRVKKNWGKIHYDPALCIVCERCVTVCKDMIGEAALKTVPRGGDALDKEWKESMPKDSYAMWNKLQKSLIGIASGEESLDCTQCGECSAVCPVGALVGEDFQYTSNAWELRKIPASNPHSSDCSLMYYDVKQTSIANSEEKIYRVSSDFNYAPLHAAARYGYDFENSVIKKDEEAFEKVLKTLKSKKVDTIVFNSFITNEEAFILQKLKEKFGYKLINKDAKAFQNFLTNFSLTSGESLYNADLQSIKDSNFLISFGTQLKNDAPNVGYALNNALGMNKGAGIYFHPLGDSIVSNYSKNIYTASHKVGAEEAIAYLILDLFAKDLPREVSTYLQSFHSTKKKTVTETLNEKVKEIVTKVVKDEQSGEDKEIEEEVEKTVSKEVEKEIEVDCNALFEIIGLDENFGEELEKLLAKKDTFSLIAGEDLYTHPQNMNIARLLGLIQRYTDFKVLLIPSQTNTLGVSLLCELDEKAGKHTLGYNEKADIILSALGEGDLDMPALNQQEGTFCSMNKRVVPTNVALSFKGYCLNDIANALGLESEYTVDYTKELGCKKGFEKRDFDDLDNEFDNAGKENRGYLLHVEKIDLSDEVKPLTDFETLQSDIIYLSNPVHQFSAFTNKAHQLNEAGALYVSEEFLETKKLNNADMVKISQGENELIIKIQLDTTVQGLISYLPTFDTKLNARQFFQSGYRFANVSIEGV